MFKTIPPYFQISAAVRTAILKEEAVVALESTVITHGLPRPDNLTLAKNMEEVVRVNRAMPATIGVLDGKILIGLDAAQLETLANTQHTRKISVRDFGAAIAQNAAGGTTVAGTLYAAEVTGIQVFATGGIGGVHRGSANDISADLPQLAKSPVIVVCAGAKAILDLPATLEYLETAGVPVIGFKTDSFPAFYSQDSGLPVNMRANSAEEVVDIATTHWEIGLKSALVVAVPPPAAVALPNEEVDEAINKALDEARGQRVRGQAVTPFLLSRVNELTKRASLQANLGLLQNNAMTAASIAETLAARKKNRAWQNI